jgi:putative ABC transport system substrate-binding protein
MLALATLGYPLAAQAGQPKQIPRIGILCSAACYGEFEMASGIQHGLSELGYVEGDNIVIEFRSAHGTPQRLPALAAELVRTGVDIIVAPTTSAALAAYQTTKTIPIVIAVSDDPVRTRLVAGLARPGGNVTGLTMLSSELIGKRLELLKEVVPTVSRIAVLINPTNETHRPEVRVADAAARSLGVQLHALEVRGPMEFDRAFSAMTTEGADALLVLGEDRLFLTHRGQITLFALKHRLPTISSSRGFAAAAGLMSYGPSLPVILRRIATYVDRILRGAKPGDLPVEQPTKFELAISLTTAKALGLKIPQSVLIRADEVIQ